MKLDNVFYKEVLRVAHDELDRLENVYDLTDSDKSRLYVQAISAATMICYHGELAKKLKQHGIVLDAIEMNDDAD